MPVLSCPHCGSVHIIIGADSDTDVCTQIHCRAIMVRHENTLDATKAIYDAAHLVDPIVEREAERQAAQAEIRRLSAIRRAAR